MTRSCDCCEGVHDAALASTPNPPGLAKLNYRIGTHASFFEAMQARLSSTYYPALAALKTRDASDFSIAMLDAWALVGDVLTFYQERIANEGYLRTACERRSILELANLVGYTVRPGVSSSVYLAYTLEKDAAPVVIPKGALSNSVPGPGETQQAFETSNDLEARFAWNTLLPRTTRLQRTIDEIEANGLYLQGTSTRLAANDPLLISVDGTPTLYFVNTVTVDNDKKRTVVTLRDSSGTAFADATGVVKSPRGTTLADIVKALTVPPSVPPANATRLPRDVGTIFANKADMAPRLLASLSPALSATLYGAWNGLPPAPPPAIQAYALRVEAQPFGHNAPLRQVGFDPTSKTAQLGEWDVTDPWNQGTIPTTSRTLAATATANTAEYHEPDKLFLDNDYDIAPDSYIAIVEAGGTPAITVPKNYIHRSLIAYGMSGKTVQVGLPENFWLERNDFAIVRTTRVYTASEELALAEAPIGDDIFGATLELGSLYDSLQPGRWLIVAGERSDTGDATGIETAELVMIAAVEQTVDTSVSQDPATGASQNETLPGEKVHTFITLAQPLAYTYARGTVTIYGNVVKATNGQTRQEVLGNGDTTQTFQTFALKQSPLTYISSPTVTGVASTLVARVNDVQWHETDALATTGAKDRKFITRTNAAEATSLIFGDGVHGARLPSGIGNVSATYRSGMGKGGNVQAEQITLLNTKPLGVKSLTNPMRASGGADVENNASARKNVPMALMALDRLVSITDYADFTRVFAGIGKSNARFRSGKQRQMVQVAIAGIDDIPIDPASDLYRNLYAALHAFGDPYLPIELTVRTRSALVISAKVKIDPDYQWETLEPKIRAALLKRFAFDNVELGQSLYLADAVRTIQNVRGVVYCDIDVFAPISEDAAVAAFTQQQAASLGLNDRIGADWGDLIYLATDVPDTLVLQEIKP